MKKEIKNLFKYFRKNKFSIFLIFILVLIYVASSVITPYLIGLSIDEIAAQIRDLSGNFKTIILMLSIISIFIVFGSIAQFIFNFLISFIIEKNLRDVRNDCFRKINYLPIKYLDSRTRGDILSLVINDTDNINLALVGFLKQFYEGILTIIFTIGFMFYINWILACVVLILSPLSFLISYKVSKNSNKFYKKQVETQAKLNGVIMEDFLNFEQIISLNYQDEKLKKFSHINKEFYKNGQKAQFISTFTNPSTRLINNFVYAIVGFVGALLCIFSSENNFVILGATSTIGVISTFLQYANQFAKPFNEMSSTISEIQQGYQSLKRINKLLFEDTENNKNIDKKFKKPLESIYFNNVSFSYDSKKEVIKNFNLKINKGEKVAFVGETGSGKTTLINLLLRFYDVTKGEILFNEENINDFTKDSIRDLFGLVLQESWIFNGNILENIGFSRINATKEEIIKCAISSNCHDFIMSLPNGFETVIDESTSLSEGQKQLLSIARAMLANKEIIVLDEATSNIDSLTEKKIVDAFDLLMKNKTSFIIAHRLSTIKKCDLIVVIKNGEVKEVGNHIELLNKKGEYFKLYNSQFNSLKEY